MSKGCVRDDSRWGCSNCKWSVVSDYKNVSAGIIGFFNCGIDYQYFSDGNIYSGTDINLCAKNSCSVTDDDFNWLMDDEHNDRTGDRFVVKF